MKKKTVEIIIKVAICTLIPSLLSYIANSKVIFNYLIEKNFIGESINIDMIQDICLWVGIVLSAILLSYDLLKTKLNYNDVLSQRNLLIKMNKEILGYALLDSCLGNYEDYNIRFFIPKHPLIYKIFKKCKKKFVIINIPEIAQEGTTKGLELEVFPDCQGLVGKCYNNKMMIYDDDLENTNSTKYRLDKNQVFRTSNLKWSICCPIFDNNSQIVAIMAIDGSKKITIDKEKENKLKEQIIIFSRMIYDNVPQLFRRK